MRKAAPAADAGELIQITGPQMREIVVSVVGNSPLLCNRMSEESRLVILGDPEAKARAKQKVFAPPEQRWQQTLHVLDPDAPKFGYPGAAFHSALINAGRFSGIAMTQLSGMFRVSWRLLEIEGDPPQMHEAMGRPPGQQQMMPIYRARFDDWRMDIPVQFDESLIPLQSFLNLFQRAGQQVGVGAFRPQNRGPFGTFSVGEVK
jgi:hypothetical protein